MNERWKIHPEFIDYAISTTGLVKRITSKMGAKVGRILKATKTPYGYRTVNVGGTPRFVHVLVLETFVGPRPADGEACHTNDTKDDNRIDNLSWGTHAKNYADRVRNGGGNHGSRHGLSKLTEEDVKAIRDAYVPRQVTHRHLARRFGVSRECIGLVIRRIRWLHV